MAFDKEGMLTKVRGLLTKAEANGVTEQEAQTLTAKAAELMAKYGIDKAMADAREHVRQRPVDKVFNIPRPYTAPKGTLLNVVAQAFRCQAIQISDERVHVFGFESDVEAVEMLYTSLLLQATSGVLRVERQSDHYGRSRTRGARSSYIYGFAVAIKQRLTVVKEEAERTPGSALVLRSRDLEVKEAMKEQYPHGRQVRRTVSNRSGYSQGHRDGQRANLHDRAQAGGSSRLALH